MLNDWVLFLTLKLITFITAPSKEVGSCQVHRSKQKKTVLELTVGKASTYDDVLVC